MKKAALSADAPKVNMAEQKRIKDARLTLTSYLERKMYDFKERYLKGYVEFKFNEFDRDIKRVQNLKFENKSKYDHVTLEQFEKNKEAKIEHIKMMKSYTYTNTLAFINEAISGYNIKFGRLIDALIEAGIRSYPLSVESVHSATEFDFSFLITHKDVQVYARIIYACGEINAPHYRFIITSNVNELHTAH